MRDHIATCPLRFMPVAGAISLNQREYPQTTVEKVIARAQEHLAAGQSLTALTHHEAGDNNLLIVGKITGENALYVDDGWYTADVQIADTAAGRDIAYLAANGYLVSCSLRGSNANVDWHDDEAAAGNAKLPTVLDFVLDGIDFTNYPGIANTPSGNASIGKVSWEAASRERLSEARAADTLVIDTFPVGAGLKDIDEDLAAEIVERREGGDDPLDKVAEVLMTAVQTLREAPRKPGRRYKTGPDNNSGGSTQGDGTHLAADPTPPVEPAAADAAASLAVAAGTDDNKAEAADTSTTAAAQAKKTAGKRKPNAKSDDDDEEGPKLSRSAAARLEAFVAAYDLGEGATDQDRAALLATLCVRQEETIRALCDAEFAEHVFETRIDGAPSFEDIRDLVCDAICDAMPRDTYCYVVATGMAACIFACYGPDYDDCTYYRQDYAIAGDTVTLSGDPQPYMLTFAPAPASGQGEESAMDKDTIERLDRLTGAIEQLVTMQTTAAAVSAATTSEPTTTTIPAEARTTAADTAASETTDTAAGAALSALEERLKALEAQLADATDPGNLVQSLVALKHGRRGIVATSDDTPIGTEQTAVEAVIADKTLDAEDKLHQVLTLTAERG